MNTKPASVNHRETVYVDIDAFETYCTARKISPVVVFESNAVRRRLQRLKKCALRSVTSFLSLQYSFSLVMDVKIKNIILK